MSRPIQSQSPAERPADRGSPLQHIQASPELDRITRTAAHLFHVPMALVSLLDEDRQWFRSRHGLDIDGTPRSISFCAHAIEQPSPMVVTDASLDPRFADNPLVTGAPHIRFYAGHTLHSLHGMPLGTLCILDTRPGSLSEDQKLALADLAMMAENYLHLCEASAETDQARSALERRDWMVEQIVDYARVGIALLDARGEFLACNRRFDALVGHGHEALLGRNLDFVLAPGDAARGLQAIEAARAGSEKSPELKLRFRRSDGSISWAQVGISVLPEASTGMARLILVATDINDLQQTQAALESLQFDLENQIQERTRELDATVSELRHEIARRQRVQAELETSAHQFQRVLANTSDAYIEIDDQDLILTWNDSAERIFGWSEQEAVGKRFGGLCVPDALRTRHELWLRRLRATGISTRMKQRIEISGLRRNGETFPLELTFSTSIELDKLVVHGFLHDISARKADETALRETTQRLKAITDNLPALIAQVGADLRYRFHNQAYCAWFDLPPGGLVRRHLSEFWGEHQFLSLRPAIDRVLAGESIEIDYTLEASDGQRWFHGNLVPHVDADGKHDGFYLLSQDFTERKRLYERIEHDALHDPLTGLPNRRALTKRLEEAMARARRSRGSVAVMFMDLDGFKQVNDTLGHEHGDALLKRFAANVAAALRESDFVARLAGDEFVAVLENLEPGRDTLGTLAGAIVKRIGADPDMLGEAIPLACSVGVAVFDPAGDEAPQALLARADAAMYEAKAKGSNRIVVR
jgi:diguanylate cyclase (GGDEF)-like protein/PAS domain S-box-containing protein